MIKMAVAMEVVLDVEDVITSKNVQIRFKMHRLCIRKFGLFFYMHKKEKPCHGEHTRGRESWSDDSLSDFFNTANVAVLKPKHTSNFLEPLSCPFYSVCNRN